MNSGVKNTGTQQVEPRGFDPALLGQAVAVIDDIFVPPNIDLFDNDSLEKLILDADSSDESRDRWNQLFPHIQEFAQCDQEFMNVLWARYTANELGALTQAVIDLLGDRHRDFQALMQFEAHLKAWNINVDKYAPDQTIASSYKVVFIDHYLGPQGDGPGRSIEVAKQVRSSGAMTAPPFIILMSGDTKVDGLKEEFRSQANVCGALFGFIPKADFSDVGRLYFRLGSLAAGSDGPVQVDQFVEEMLKSLGRVTEEFSKDLRSLSATDYNFIQQEALVHDGHPLGDYILWLCASMLSYQFRNDQATKLAQGKLDGFVFPGYVHCEPSPTANLARLYQKAVTEPIIPEQLHHPHDTDHDIWHLDLGDLFFSEDGLSVYMVMSASCDLQFSPRGSRKFVGDRSVLILPGSLVAHSAGKKVGDLTICTEHFVHNNEACRIIWDEDRILTIPYGEISKFMKARKYSRQHRLRPLFAIAVQNRVFSRLSRVGAPVSPPPVQYFQVQLWYFGQAGSKAQKIGEVLANGAMLCFGSDSKAKPRLHISTACIYDILSKASSIDALMLETQSKVDARRQAKAKERLETFRSYVADTDPLLRLCRKPHGFGSDLQAVDGKKILGITSKVPGDDPLTSHQEETPLVLVLTAYKPQSVVAPASTPTSAPVLAVGGETSISMPGPAEEPYVS